MTIYWILLAIPAVMAFIYPLSEPRGPLSLGQRAALLGFALLYAVVAMLRYEVGGDWHQYLVMYDVVRSYGPVDAMASTDPLFGLTLWVSNQLDAGIYVPNGICALLLGLGVARVAGDTRNPWLAMAMAVPYVFIVVGMGYVRQGAALGLILLAAGAVARGHTVRSMIFLALSLGFHSTSVVVWPFFAWALATRNKLRIFMLATVGSAIFFVLVSSRLEQFDQGYLESEYDSSGALVRLLMGLIPALLMLARWKHFEVATRARPLWLGFAIANVLLFVALGLSPSSTAVDRMAVYFSVVQIVTMGNIIRLTGASERTGLFLRVLAFGTVSAVQLVWLVYATHASYWVPYHTVLAFL